MTDTVRRPRWLQRVALPFAAGCTLLGFTFVNFLNHHSYPLLRPELGYFYGGLLLLCAAMAALYDTERRFGRALLEALLVGLVIDLNLDLPWLTAAAALGSLLWVLWSRRSLLPFAVPMGSIMLLMSLAGVGADREWIRTVAAQPSGGGTEVRSDKPAILHLILDEHGGFEGFPLRSPGADLMKAELRDFYQSRGFAMFGRAYSEHYETANALSHMFNFGASVPPQQNPKKFVTVRPNRYLAGIREAGYRLHIYQSDFADLCGAAAPDSCTTYRSASAGALLGTSLSHSDRAQLILFKFLSLSDVLHALNMQSPPTVRRYITDHEVNPPLERLGYTGPIASLLTADRLAEDLRNARQGDAFVAHLLIPHFPWVVEPDCTIRALEEWDRQILIPPVQQREVAYFDQLRCSLRKADQLLQALAHSPAGGNSIVVVHGDHGSRISARVPNVFNHPHVSREDLIAGFSTLFAVRSQSIGPAYVPEPAQVADLLRQLSESRFRGLPTPAEGQPRVYISDDDWQPRQRVALPSDW